MEGKDGVKFMATLARENARAARRERTKFGPREPMAFWYDGRSKAFMSAARAFKGGPSARMRNALKRARAAA